MSERKDRERRERERRIVATARELAEREGWSAVTTRRLAELIDHSQPVLYSHFPNMAAVADAVAIEGFAELAAALRRARRRAGDAHAALLAVARAYRRFARERPATFEAMFVRPTALTFASAQTPDELRAGFGELREAIRPFAGEEGLDHLTEVAWATIHGIVTLEVQERVPTDRDGSRLRVAVDLLTAGAARPVPATH